jgi:hypothetical protein
MHYLLKKINVTRVVYTLLICCLLTPLRCANTNIILQTAFKHIHSICSAPPTYSCDPGYASAVGTKQSCCLSTFYLLFFLLSSSRAKDDLANRTWPLCTYTILQHKLLQNVYYVHTKHLDSITLKEDEQRTR